MDDEGDFKKARGFLLTYSALVLALWYFGADLTQFKLMGNEIMLHQRTESVWFVLALVNAYFWFRCYQRVPRLGLYFDGPMNDLYDISLVWTALKLKRRALRNCAAKEFMLKHDPDEKMKVTSFFGVTTARGSLEEDQRHHGNEAAELHQVSRKFRTTMHLSAGYAYTDKGTWIPFSTNASYGDYSPSAIVTWPVKAFAIIRGAFVTPWFTDHVMPLALGAISTGFALWKWCEMNFFAATLPHVTQLCAGITH